MLFLFLQRTPMTTGWSNEAEGGKPGTICPDPVTKYERELEKVEGRAA